MEKRAKEPLGGVLTVRLPQPLDAALRAEAERLGVRVVDVARLALARGLFERPVSEGAGAGVLTAEAE